MENKEKGDKMEEYQKLVVLLIILGSMVFGIDGAYEYYHKEDFKPVTYITEKDGYKVVSIYTDDEICQEKYNLEYCFVDYLIPK